MRPVKKPHPSKEYAQTVKSSDKEKEKVDSPTNQFIHKLTSDIQAIEEKLSKVEGVLSKKNDTASTSQKSHVNFAELKRESPVAHKEYNASDYIDSVNTIRGYSPYYDSNTYASELQKSFINTLGNPLPQQYPLDFDSKAAISAIRSELEEWRKVTKQKYPIAPISLAQRNDVSSVDYHTSISEENTVSRDVEKDSSSLDSRSKFQDQANRKEAALTSDSKAIPFPLDYYLELEKNKNKNKLLKPQVAEGNALNRTENLIQQINELAAEAEERFKACIYEKSSRPQPLLSPVSLHESDSGYTEHLVETKFNEVTYKSKGTGTRYEQPISLKDPWHNELDYYSINHGEETYRSTADTTPSSGRPPKKANQRKFNTALETAKNNFHTNPKSSSRTKTENRKIIEQSFKKKYPKETNQCSCSKTLRGCTDFKLMKDSTKARIGHQHDEDSHQDFIDNNEPNDFVYCEKQYIDASVNTEPMLSKLNAHLVNVVSSQEDKSAKMNDYANKLCQIQELPKVVIRPNFTKQVGPVIDIKTTKPSLQQNNVAVVECVHGGPLVTNKGNLPNVSLTTEPGIDIASQTVSPPAVHFRNSRDLKLLKVAKDLLGKLNFKDGVNVEKLKRSLTNLASLLNQISPIHVANLRLGSLDAVSASESIDTFFSNIDLVTEILENEIKKPTGRYCDYPECLVKAVDLLCGNIKSIFVIEESRKKTKPSESFMQGDKKKRVKKPAGTKSIKSPISKKVDALRPSSATSTTAGHDINEISPEDSRQTDPSNLYIPFRLLIPGGKHREMEAVRSTQDIQLRFKRLEKVMEINQILKDKMESTENFQIDKMCAQSQTEEEKSFQKCGHVLNETFIIESENIDIDEKKSEAIQENLDTKMNKSEPDYEDDWEIDSSRSNDGSLAMTEIKVAALIHSTEAQTSLAHSSPKRHLLYSNKLSSRSDLSSKGSQTENLGSVQSFQRESQPSSIYNKEEEHMIRQNSNKKKIRTELVDVETQYKTNKEDKATMHCEDHMCQKPHIDEIIEPITPKVEASSFTVLKMTNPSKNSQLEVRFPGYTGKFHSSLTVQKTENSEEINLLYNMNKDESINQEINKINVSPQLAPIKKVDSKSEHNDKNLPSSSNMVHGHSSVKSKDDLNDFQSITTNFIQFLESKVNEMVGKFKLSEVTCENLLDQKLMGNSDYKASQASVHNFHISSSKTSLKNEVFYKSATSLFSNQSNDDAPMIGNSLSQRCTPDNQEITPFQNLTSPPVGLQLKENSGLTDFMNLKGAENCLQNKDVKLTLDQNPRDNLIFNNNILEKENLSFLGNGEKAEMINNNQISNEITGQMSYLKVNEDQNRKVLFNGFQNRLLPLPEDVINNKIIGESKEENSTKQKQKRKTLSNENLIALPSKNEDRSSSNVYLVEEVVEHSLLKSHEISQTKSASFEETIVALMSVEECFEKNEESTMLLAKRSQGSSKNEDDADSQGTSVSNFVNILSPSENGRMSPASPIIKFPASLSKELSDTTPSEAIKNDRKVTTSTVLNPFSMDRYFPKTLPVSEPITEEQLHLDQIDKNCSKMKSSLDSDVNVHTLFIRGPSHIDEGLNSPDNLCKIIMESSEKKMADSSAQILLPDHANIQTNCSASVSSSSKISLPPSSDAVIQTMNKETCNNSSQTSPPDEISIHIIDNVTNDNSSQILPPINEAEQASMNALNADSIVNPPDSGDALNTEELGDQSDNSIQINYYNPEEMSDGEVGYVYTSNSYSSGEIKPCNEQNEDDSLSGPPTFREVTQNLHLQESTRTNKVNVTDSVPIGSNCTETDTSALRKHFQNTIVNCHLKNDKNLEKEPDGEVSSNDSTSTAELKNLFNAEDKIDEGLLGKLIDIHIRCSTSFSSESSPHEIVESMDEN